MSEADSKVLRRAKLVAIVVLVALAIGAARTMMSRSSNARALEAGTAEQAKVYVKVAIPTVGGAGTTLTLPGSLQGEVQSLDLGRKRVVVDFGELSFDYLIIACGARHSYFGHDEWEQFAPGLKTVEQATEIRRRVLLAYVVGTETMAAAAPAIGIATSGCTPPSVAIANST